MESRIKILGHPVHQVLVMFPIGMLGWATACDVAAMATKNAHHGESARNALLAGVALGTLAAPFGLVDWLAIPRGTRAKAIGAAHGIGNACMLGLFAASWLLRRGKRNGALARALSFGGFALSIATAWLGTELINRLGVGVYAPTDLDASSSLLHSHVGRAAVAATEVATAT